MPLIPCPDCGRQISDAAPLCIGCGRPMRPMAGAGVSPGAPIDHGPDACPRCGGRAESFRTLHERGTTTGPAQTPVSPPDRSTIDAGGGCGYALLGAAILAGLVWFVADLLWAALAFLFGFFAFARLAHSRAQPLVDERYQTALARWERRWLCRSCGATLVRADDGTLMPDDGAAEIDELIRSGQKIEAIKRVRERSGLGLKEAMERVEAREKELR